MILIDRPMPKCCYDCQFADWVTGACIASEYTDNFFYWFDSVKDTSDRYKEMMARRDPRCPLKEIVRCADCTYCVKEPNGELYCDILAVGYEPLGSKKVNGDWFCADGERKVCMNELSKSD